MRRIPYPLLLLAVVTFAAPCRAVAQTEPERTVERQKIVVRSTDDGESEDLLWVDENGDRTIGFDAPMLSRTYLGVSSLDMTPELRLHYGAPEDRGVLIAAVESDSPAARAGLTAGDILAAVDGEEVRGPAELARLIRGREAQDTVSLEVWRDRRAETFSAVLGERERPQIDVGRLFVRGDDGDGHAFAFGGAGDVFDHVVAIDPEEMRKALGELGEQLEDSDFLERMQSLGEHRQLLEQRVQELEERLRALEGQLEELQD